MAKTDLKIKSTSIQKGTAITTSINYVNPDADSITLRTLGQKLNALTTNIYNESDRVQTINVDTEEVPITPTPKIEPTLTVGNWTWQSNNGFTANITYNGDGYITLATPPSSTSGTSSSIKTTDIIYNNNKPMSVRVVSTQQVASPIQVFISASEGELYAPKFIISTINE